MALSTVNILFRGRGLGKLKTQMRGVRKEAKGIGAGLGGLGKAGVAGAAVAGVALVGAAYARAAKKVLNFNRELKQLARQGGLAAKEQAALRQQLGKISIETGKSREELLAFSQGVVDSTGDINIATGSLRLAARAAVSTGADMGGLGLIISDMALKFGMTGEEAGKALRVLVEQGDKGRFTLGEMARTGAELFSVASLGGFEGAEGLREMGAVVQLVRQGFGSAEKAATGFRTLVTRVLSSENTARLQELGVALRDPDTGELRKFGDVFIDILRATNGDVQQLSQIFGQEGILGVTEFGRIMKRNGGSIDAVNAELDKYRNVTASARDEALDFQGAQKEGATQMDRLAAAWEVFKDATITSEGTLGLLATQFENLTLTVEALTGHFQDVGDQYKYLATLIGIKIGEEQDIDKLANKSQAARAAKLTPGEIRAEQTFNKLMMDKNIDPSIDLSAEERRALQFFIGTREFKKLALPGVTGFEGKTEDEQLGIALKTLQRGGGGLSASGLASRFAPTQGATFGQAPLALGAGGAFQFESPGVSDTYAQESNAAEAIAQAAEAGIKNGMNLTPISIDVKVSGASSADVSVENGQLVPVSGVSGG